MTSEPPPAARPPRARPGRRAPTSQDVADLAGVSRTVVSFVLNNRPHTGIPEETRQRVLGAAATLGYRPNSAARSLVSGRTWTLGVIINESRDDATGDAFLPPLLRGIDSSARAGGFRLLLAYLGERHADEPSRELVDEGRVDGVLLWGPRPHERALDDLMAIGAPVVVVGHPGAAACPSVDIDNVAAARAAVGHLVDHGYQRIGFISHAPLTVRSSQQRLEGYQQALAAAGLPLDAALIVEGALDEASGRSAMRRLLALIPPPRAVFVASDRVAAGALAAARAAGARVPDDLALMGFDDLALAVHLTPPLSTVHVPAQELGALACRRLIDLINGQVPAEPRVTLPTTLVARQSCGHHPESEPG